MQPRGQEVFLTLRFHSEPNAMRVKRLELEIYQSHYTIVTVELAYNF